MTAVPPGLQPDSAPHSPLPASGLSATSGPLRQGIELPLLWLLIGISALGPFTLNGVLPATSAVMAELETRYSLAQLVLTVFLIASLIAQLVLGPVADRYGRRPVMISSLVVYAVGGLLCAIAPNIEFLLAARFIQGFGAATCTFLPRTIVRDIYNRDRAASVIGYMTTAMMVAPLFGPAIGGWVTDQFSWRWMYAGLGISGCLFTLLSWRYQRETLAAKPLPGTHTSLLSATGILLKNRSFVSYALMLTGSVGAYYSFLAGAPYVMMESRGYSASVYGAWFAMVAVGYMSGNLVAGRLSQRVGVDPMILYGFVPAGIGVVLFWLLSGWSHPLGLFVPMQLIAVSNGMSIPNITSGAMSVRPDLAASASGLAGSLQIGFGVLLTVLLGWLLPSGDSWLYVLVSFSALVCAFGWWISADRQ